jgi:hypothetical protein
VIDELRGLIQDKFQQDKGIGDFVAYTNKEKVESAKHSAIIVNSDWGIACHTGSRCGDEPISDVGFSRFFYCRIKKTTGEKL